MENSNKLRFIFQLDITTKNNIVEDLVEVGLSHDDIMRALNSRLVDLEDTIDITKYLY